MALKGITWNHPRGLNPLVQIGKQWRGGDQIHWTARSLASFEETSIAQLAREYDLIAIDHPFMGTAAAGGMLRPLDGLLNPALLHELAHHSVGQSYASYRYADRLWAVPIDAAAQVAAWRPDLLTRAGAALPTRWQDIAALADAGVPVAMAANPTHLFLALATVCEAVAPGRARNADLTPAWWTGGHLQPDVAVPALDLLRAVLARCHPMGWTSDPIAILETMACTDEIAFVPCVFGYSNYARPTGARHRVAFGAVPGASGGGTLGGVGLALAAQCQEVAAAVDFLEHVCSADVQRGLFFAEDGQPGHRLAWEDPQVNQACPQFFRDTMASLDASVVRPRQLMFPEYQHRGGELLHRLVREGVPSGAVVAQLNTLWERMRAPHAAA